MVQKGGQVSEVGDGVGRLLIIKRVNNDEIFMVSVGGGILGV